MAILAYLPEEVSPIVALPGKPPEWIDGTLVKLHHTPNNPYGRLRWEQVTLPAMAQRSKVSLLHLTMPTPPLLGEVPTVISPTGFGMGGKDWFGDLPKGRNDGDFFTRLRGSLSRGGAARLKGILWPADLPAPDLSGDLYALPPFVPAQFVPESERDSEQIHNGSISDPQKIEGIALPESYILYHGPLDMAHLGALLQTWKWASGPISDNYPLLILGGDAEIKNRLKPLAQEFDLWGSFDILTDVSVQMLPLIYWRSAAVLHPAPASPWSGPVRLALACGRPLVAYETAHIDAIVGPAAYLVPLGDTRALGAGLVTLVVEELVAEGLSQAARQRSADWRNSGFGQDLLTGYRKFLA